MSSGCWCLAESFLFPRALGATDVRLEARICRVGCGGWRGGGVGDQVPAFSSLGAFDVAGLVPSISDAGVAGRDGFAQE